MLGLQWCTANELTDKLRVALGYKRLIQNIVCYLCLIISLSVDQRQRQKNMYEERFRTDDQKVR